MLHPPLPPPPTPLAKVEFKIQSNRWITGAVRFLISLLLWWIWIGTTAATVHFTVDRSVVPGSVIIYRFSYWIVFSSLGMRCALCSVSQTSHFPLSEFCFVLLSHCPIAHCICTTILSHLLTLSWSHFPLHHCCIAHCSTEGGGGGRYFFPRNLEKIDGSPFLKKEFQFVEILWFENQSCSELKYKI
jgi:hypothetical protein